MNPEKPTNRDENQGEGDRRSAHHYNDAAREFVDRGKVAPAAHDAKQYVEREPGDASRAEREAQRGPSGARTSGVAPVIDRLVGKARSYVEMARPIVTRAVGKLRARYARK